METRIFMIVETKEGIAVHRVLGKINPDTPPIFTQAKPIGDIFEVVYKMVTGELPL